MCASASVNLHFDGMLTLHAACISTVHRRGALRIPDLSARLHDLTFQLHTEESSMLQDKAGRPRVFRCKDLPAGLPHMRGDEGVFPTTKLLHWPEVVDLARLGQRRLHHMFADRTSGNESTRLFLMRNHQDAFHKDPRLFRHDGDDTFQARSGWRYAPMFKPFQAPLQPKDMQ